MKYASTILDTIGNTPLVKLNNITKEIDALVLAKVEALIQVILLKIGWQSK